MPGRLASGSRSRRGCPILSLCALPKVPAVDRTADALEHLLHLGVGGFHDAIHQVPFEPLGIVWRTVTVEKGRI